MFSRTLGGSSGIIERGSLFVTTQKSDPSSCIITEADVLGWDLEPRMPLVETGSKSLQRSCAYP